ncbi:hypothetical protein V1478_014432 [Vespula squamosa]|uniref:Uncharacterized protein n=1 Tax=Vespula squamosa TaxID=30214 RepID=A0ABD2A839_VESSQ
MGHICQILVINAQVCFVMVHIAPHVLDFYFTLRLYAIEIRQTDTRKLVLGVVTAEDEIPAIRRMMERDS